MRSVFQKIHSFQSLSRTDKICWLAAFTVLFLFVLVGILKRVSGSDTVYSAFSDSPTAVRPKAMFSYNAFVYEGIRECYLEVFFVRDKKTFLRMQHPAFEGEAVLEFTESQSLDLIGFIDKYIDQLPEDRVEKTKAHMVGTFHESLPAKHGKGLSIVVDYLTERLKYHLFFGNVGMSPELDSEQLIRLRNTVQNALDEEIAFRAKTGT